MTYYVNDTKNQITILSCSNLNEANIYAAWAKESDVAGCIEVEYSPRKINADGDVLLRYYGFSIDSLVDSVFVSMPKRSQNCINKSMIKMMLRFPDLPKNQCCLLTGREPTHYSRLSKLMSTYCRHVAQLSGGRNPMKLLRCIRGDL